ncbi:MAG: OmpL47-type beta-barrel domain-containing protein [Anaerolineaceae bacterium]|jgi:photosystem II stability/assembly factor-like uncharacterized protein
MRKYTISVITLLLVLGLLLSSDGSAAASFQGIIARGDSQVLAQTAVPNLPNLDFGIVSSKFAWLASDKYIFKSANQGATWESITPAELGNASIGRVFFLDEKRGYVLLAPLVKDRALPGLLKTSDAGASWQSLTSPLSALPAGDETPIAKAVGMQWLDTQTGYVLYQKGSSANFSLGLLFKTGDGGSTWTLLNAPSAGEFVFTDKDVAYSRSPLPGGGLSRTFNGGETWESVDLSSETNNGLQENYEMPVFTSDGAGILPVLGLDAEGKLKQFLLYFTKDNGRSWQSLEQDSDLSVLEAGQIPRFTISVDGTLAAWYQALSDRDNMPKAGTEMDTANTFTLTKVVPTGGLGAWGLFSGGNCAMSQLMGEEDQDGGCQRMQNLASTSDGGKTWKAIALPEALILSSDSALSAKDRAVEDVPTAVNDDFFFPTATISNIQYASGQGFDTCEIPTLAKMQTWYDSSPYHVVNLYIGGSARGCSNTPLTATYVRQMYLQGWRFIPTWVGPQAPCTDFRSKISSDPATAYQQGVDNANQAVTALKNLGLANADGSGSVVYYDMESFSNSNTSCMTAVRSFLDGWNTRLKQYNTKSGVYGTSSNLNNFYTIDPRSDMVWVAEWYSNYYYRPDETIDGILYLNKDYWTPHQRLYQYTGGHYETWGGVSINIDCNVLDGLVAVPWSTDVTSPVTNVAVTGTKGSNNWYVSTVKLTVTATDEDSGVAYTRYRINDGDWVDYSAPIQLSTTGNYKVEIQTMDLALNWNEIQTFNIAVDSSAPVTNATPTGSAGVEGWYRSAVSVALSATDTLAGVNATQYRINEGTWMDYSAPISISTEGITNIGYRSQDKAGNWEAEKTLAVKIDTALPTTAASLSGTKGEGAWFISPVTLTLISTDGSSGIDWQEYRPEGGVWERYSSPVLLTQNANKIYEFRSSDKAGNISAIEKVSIAIDTVAPPHPTITGVGCDIRSGEMQKICRDLNFMWTESEDNLSGFDSFEYYWGTNLAASSGTITTDTTYDPPISDPNTVYYLNMRTRDAAGNVSDWKTLFSLAYIDGEIHNFILPLVFR